MDNDDSVGWEMPGGGWEHGESLAECLTRELAEELGVKPSRIGEVKLIYKNVSSRGYQKINIAVEVELESIDFKPNEMKEAKFVTEQELLSLKFAADEAAILKETNNIWPTVE